MDTRVAPLRFRRILLKLSGEALAGGKGFGVDPEILNSVSRDVRAVREAGGQVAIVIGGGNYMRGTQADKGGIGRAAGDCMGMLATTMNCIALQDALERHDCPATVFSAIRMEPLCSYFSRREVENCLERGNTALFAAGTGNPFFTTDTAACLRGAEINAQVVMKATKVDGVYSADPVKDASAQKFERISFDEVLKRGLSVMDTAAIALSRENELPILVFRLQEGNLLRAACGESVGTLVHS